MDFAPDGRLFVCEQTGRLRVIKNGTLLPAPFVTLTVDPSGERGLLGVAFDPDFGANHFVYVYYTATTTTIHNRVSRFTASGDVAVGGSEVVILELENLGATNHNGGAIHFGLDGKLYIATGENAVPSNSQTLANKLGKILRINSDGTIPSDNPFLGSAMGTNRAIWALGLRNPFTFSFQNGTGRIFINDVGQSAFEEIDDGIAGSNYGWPDTEGQTMDPRFRSPLFSYGHGSGTSAGCAITGGAFYSPAIVTFPPSYGGDYFFADLCNGWIRKFDPGDSSVTVFATGIANPVDLKVHPDGSLYYLSIGSGAVFQVQAAALSIDDVTIIEPLSSANAVFTVTLSAASGATVSVNFATADGTATASSDFSATSGTLTFAPGETSKTVSLAVSGDTTFEPDETFFVNLSGATNAITDDAQGRGTIVNDDLVPSISINDVAVTEGNAGTVSAGFTVALSNPSYQTITVNFATAANSATFADGDYVANSGTLTFGPGTTTQPVSVTVNGDIASETNEAFFVNLSGAANASLADAQGVGTILNDDAEVPHAFLLLGQTASPTLSTGGEHQFAVALTADRSYIGFCRQPLVEGGGNCTLDIRNAATGLIESVVSNGEPAPVAGNHIGESKAVVPLSNGSYLLTVRNGLAGTAVSRVAIVETTLFAPGTLSRRRTATRASWRSGTARITRQPGFWSRFSRATAASQDRPWSASPAMGSRWCRPAPSIPTGSARCRSPTARCPEASRRT